MTGTFLKVVMAASALMPVAATAQRRGADVGVSAEGRGDRGDRWAGGERGDRPSGREQRGDVATSAQARVEYRPDRNDDRRGYRNDPQRQPIVQTDRRDDPQGYRQYGRDDRQAYQGRRDDDRRFHGGQQYRGDGNAQGYRGGYDGRADNRWGTRSQWNGGQQNRGQWNRGWRGDDRFAWSDYRASHRGAYRLPRYYAPNGWGSGYRRFGVGFTLSSALFNRNYWIQDPYTYRLPEAYGPYRWVRYYDDALLVDLDSGRVVDTVYSIFW